MVEMVTPRNDSIELSMVKEKQRPLPTAPPAEEYFNGNTLELGKGKRPPAPPPRKRCWTVVTLVVVVLVVIGAGTIVFYEHLMGRLMAESSSNGHGPMPEVSTDYKVVTERVPGLSDPFPEESSQRSMPSTTEVIFIDSSTTEESIDIDSSKEESVEDNSVDGTTSEDPDSGSGDVSDRDSSESTEEITSDGGSGSGSGDDSEA